MVEKGSMSLRIHIEKHDPEVRQPSVEVDPATLNTPAMQTYADDLIDAMIRYDGIGIASCQVGKNIRMAVIAKDYVGTDEHLIIVNPRIVSASEKTGVMEEGCLSVPGVFGPVERPIKIRVKALSRTGEPLDLKAKGMFARILQHEIDHLDGLLFIDKAVSLNKK
jgi:peptide deformylase